MDRLDNLFLSAVILLTYVTQWAQSGEADLYKADVNYRLQARIHEFQFRSGNESISDLPKEKIVLGSKTMENQANRDDSFIFEMAGRIEESVVLKVAEAFTKMDGTVADPSLKFDYDSILPVVTKSYVQHKIVTDYQWNKEADWEEKRITVDSDEAKLHQRITIPACKKCVVTAFAQKVKNFRVDYTALAQVSAAQGLSPLPAEEIRKILPVGMKYIRGVDQHTNEVSVEGSMLVNFGWSTGLDVKCQREPTPNCQFPSKSLSSADNHQIYEAPFQMTTANNYMTKSTQSTILSFLKNALGVIVMNLG